MIRNLLKIENVPVDAGNKAKVELKRGMFVKVDEAKGEINIATDLTEAIGIVVRDVVVTDSVAQGLPISDYDVEQDTIKVKEFAGVRGLYNGEAWMTDQFKADCATPNGDKVQAGKYLTVENGLLKESESNAKTELVSLGLMDDNGHKVLGFKVVK